MIKKQSEGYMTDAVVEKIDKERKEMKTLLL